MTGLILLKAVAGAQGTADLDLPLRLLAVEVGRC